MLRSTVPQFAIKVDGRTIPDDAMHALLESVVESSLHLPDACTIRLHDADFKWLDERLFQEGGEVEIQAGQGRDPLHTIFQGEVTTIELDLAAMGVPTLTIRCMDKAHRLHRGKERRTHEQVKDSDIVRKVAQEMGLQADIDETSLVHPWVLQNNQSNWEFLSMLAERNGFRLYLEGKDKLSFKKVQDEPPTQTELEWGKDLRSFRLRVSSSPQVEEVVVRSWDPDTKQAIVGTAKNPKGTAKIEERGEGAAVGNQAFGKAKMVIVDRPVKSQREAETVAQSVIDEIAASFIEADGLCYGHPELRPGGSVKISNIGKRFSGEYIVTSTTHTYSPAEGFSTQFVISGKKPSTLLAILGGAGKSDGKASPNAGNIVVAIVTDNLDPENRGRIKVKFPWLTEDLQSHWVRVASPMAGAGRGFTFLPEIDDEVLVAFEHGDVNRPFMIGALWNGKDAPPVKNSQAVEGGKVRRRWIQSRSGHVIELDDNGRITITTSSGEEVFLQEGKGIQVSTPNGHRIFAANDGRVMMVTKEDRAVGASDKDKNVAMFDGSGNSVHIDSTANTISIKSTMAVNVQAMGVVSVTGAQILLNSPGAPAMAKAPSTDAGMQKDPPK